MDVNTVTRTINDAGLTVTVAFTKEDINLAFGGPSPDLALWYQWTFDAAWNALKDFQKCDVVAKIAKLVADATATNLNLAADAPEPK